MHLVHNVLHHEEPATRKVAHQALRYHHHEDDIFATKALLKDLYHPSIQRTKADLDGFRDYFSSRRVQGASDRQLAKAGLIRVDLVQQAVKATSQVRDPIFKPLDWNYEVGGK